LLFSERLAEDAAPMKKCSACEQDGNGFGEVTNEVRAAHRNYVGNRNIAAAYSSDAPPNPADLIDKYPTFFWNVVSAHLGAAIADDASDPAVWMDCLARAAHWLITKHATRKKNGARIFADLC
jgi:hypothetical protein